jgi:hypothetical protein
MGHDATRVLDETGQSARFHRAEAQFLPCTTDFSHCEIDDEIVSIGVDAPIAAPRAD